MIDVPGHTQQQRRMGLRPWCESLPRLSRRHPEISEESGRISDDMVVTDSDMQQGVLLYI